MFHIYSDILFNYSILRLFPICNVNANQDSTSIPSRTVKLSDIQMTVLSSPLAPQQAGGPHCVSSFHLFHVTNSFKTFFFFPAKRVMRVKFYVYIHTMQMN